MFFKKISLLILSTIFLYSNQNLEVYKDMGVITPEIKATIKKFKKINKKENKYFKINDYKHLEKPKSDLDRDIELSKILYKGDDFMTKEEYITLADKVLEARKFLKNNLASEYILYLTSESVPNYAYMNILHSVGILQENGIHIRTKQYLVGPPKDFKKYMMDKKEYMDKMTNKEMEKVVDNFQLKLDPRMFDMFDIKEVPALVLAYCTAKNPTKKTCKFKYLIRGDGSLTNFFDKISEKDIKYKKYYEILLANKIIHNQTNEDNNE